MAIRVHNYEMVESALRDLSDRALAKKLGLEVADVLDDPLNPPGVSYTLRGTERNPDRKIVEFNADFMIVYTVMMAVPTTDIVVRIRAFGRIPDPFRN